MLPQILFIVDGYGGGDVECPVRFESSVEELRLSQTRLLLAI